MVRGGQQSKLDRFLDLWACPTGIDKKSSVFEGKLVSSTSVRVV